MIGKIYKKMHFTVENMCRYFSTLLTKLISNVLLSYNTTNYMH